jgi:hypothetical protein
MALGLPAIASDWDLLVDALSKQPTSTLPKGVLALSGGPPSI